MIVHKSRAEMETFCVRWTRSSFSLRSIQKLTYLLIATTLVFLSYFYLILCHRFPLKTAARETNRSVACFSQISSVPQSRMVFTALFLFFSFILFLFFVILLRDSNFAFVSQ